MSTHRHPLEGAIPVQVFQRLLDRDLVLRTITSLFVAADARAWDGVTGPSGLRRGKNKSGRSS